MRTELTKDSLLWMCDTGVSPDDVKWLQQVSANGALRISAVAGRIQRIQDVAYEGLLATIVPQHRASAPQ